MPTHWTAFDYDPVERVKKTTYADGQNEDVIEMANLIWNFKKFQDPVPKVFRGLRSRAGNAALEVAMGTRASVLTSVSVFVFLVPLVYAAPLSDQGLSATRFEAHVSQLMRELASGSPKARERAASEIGEIGPDARRAVPLLAKALGDREVQVRRSAALALFRMAGDSKPSISALLIAVRDRDAIVRANAVLALGEARENSSTVRTALAAAAKDEDDRVRQNAADALEALDRSCRQP